MQISKELQDKAVEEIKATLRRNWPSDASEHDFEQISERRAATILNGAISIIAEHSKLRQIQNAEYARLYRRVGATSEDIAECENLFLDFEILQTKFLFEISGCSGETAQALAEYILTKDAS